jgi:hypothetical protein
MFRRGSTFWSHDGETGKQESLGTKDRREAQIILHAKNEPRTVQKLERGLCFAIPGLSVQMRLPVSEELLATK